jgi:hypothetical protein
MGPSIASNTSKKPTVRKTTQLSPLGDYPGDKLDYYKPSKMFKKNEKANLPSATEKVLKEKIPKDNISTSVKDMAKNPLKKISSVAKGGVAKTFGQLEQKYGKKDSLKDMVDTSGTFLGAGGREPEKKKTSILGTLMPKYKCRNCGKECRARKGSGPEKEQLCIKCYQQYQSQLPGRDKKEAKQAAASNGKSEESKEEEGEEKPGKITKGKVGLILASIGGMIAGYFPFVKYFSPLANSFLVVGGTSIAMITLSMFLPSKKQGVVIPLWLLTSLGGLYATGNLAPVMPVFATAANDVKDIATNVGTGWNNFMCFMKTSDPNCWEPPKTEEDNVNKIGEYQTLQMSEGRKTSTGTLDNPKPVGDQRYAFEVTLKNINEKIYEINITEIKAWAENETFPADHVYTGLSETDPYVLKPKEDFPVRFMWGYKPSPDPGWHKIPECPNGIINFKINVSSRQYGGGFSNYGIAPSDEGDWIKFLHYFDPETTAEPGPLNIYVYTDPYAIDWSYFNNDFDNNGQVIPFYIVIKITNPKVQDSVAILDKLYLVQTFEAGSQFFNIQSPCEDDLGNEYSLGSSTCSLGNCYEFSLKKLEVNFDESREIICKANIVPGNAPKDHITDQIRVYTPYYDFKQKFIYHRSCKMPETTMPTTAPIGSTTAPTTIEPSPNL